MYINKDALSHIVTFKVINGSWNDGTTVDKTVTVTGYEGDMLKLMSDQIPAVGSKPNANYKEGSWDVVPSEDGTITKDITYTYTYVLSGEISSGLSEEGSSKSTDKPSSDSTSNSSSGGGGDSSSGGGGGSSSSGGGVSSGGGGGSSLGGETSADNNNNAISEKATDGKNPTVSVGSELNATDNNTYIVLGGAEVSFIGNSNGDATELIIPKTTTVDGKTYIVTSIADNAFKNNDKIESLIIGDNIISIGENAFAGCENLETIVIGSNVEIIGKNAFDKTNSLRILKIKSDKLTKAGVKNSLKGSKVKRVELVGAAKKKAKKYKKYFSKKNCGKKVKVK